MLNEPNLSEILEDSSNSRTEKKTREKDSVLVGIFCNSGITAHSLGSHCNCKYLFLSLMRIFPVVAPIPIEEETIVDTGALCCIFLLKIKCNLFL